MMKKIKRHGNTIKFNRVVAYGCSYTVGQELPDHEILNLSEDEVDTIKRNLGVSRFYSKYKRKIPSKLKRKENELSWARWFSDELGVDYANRAQSGSSVQWSIYKIESDLASGFLKDTDLIVVGLTTVDRWFYLDKTCWPRTPLLGWPTHEWKTQEFYHEFITHAATDYTLFYNYYQSVKYLDMLSKNLGNRLIQQFTVDTFSNYVSLSSKKIQNSPLVEMTKQLLNFESIVDPEFSFKSLITDFEKDSHGFSHPKLRLHKLFANKLAEKLLARS